MKQALLILLALTHLSTLPVQAADGRNSLVGLKFEFDGVNCWATALASLGIRKDLTYVSDKEFTATLGSPALCRKLGAGEIVPPDAIGAIRTNSSGVIEELHGFKVIAHDQVLTKRDYTHESAIQVRSLRTDFEIFAKMAADSANLKEAASFASCGPILTTQGYRVTNQVCHTWVDFYVCRPDQTVGLALHTLEGRILYSSISSLIRDFADRLKRGAQLSELETAAYLERMSPIMEAAYALKSDDDKKIITALYESAAYTFGSVQAGQKTKSEIPE